MKLKYFIGLVLIQAVSFTVIAQDAAILKIPAGKDYLLPVQKALPGIYNGALKIRAENGFSGRIELYPEFYTAAGKFIGNPFSRILAPGKEWTEVPYTFILPDDAASFQIKAKVKGTGNAEICFHSLPKRDGAFFGRHSFLSVAPAKKGFLVSSSAFQIQFADLARFFTPCSLSVGEKKLLNSVYLVSLRADKKSSAEYTPQSGNVEKITVSDDNEAVTFRFDCVWETLRYSRMVSFYKDKPYLKLFYDLTAVKDFFSVDLSLAVDASGELNMLVVKHGAAASFRPWEKPRWFSISRPDQDRWVAWCNRENNLGVAVIGADPDSWKDFYSRLMCSMRKDGGFHLDLEKWKKKEIRKGDTTSIEIFIAVLNGPAEQKAAALQKSICGE